jgi:hypothetical protein
MPYSAHPPSVDYPNNKNYMAKVTDNEGYVCIREVFGLSFGRDTGYAEICYAFPQSFQVNAGILHLLGHHRFLLNPFQFIIRHAANRCYIF